METIKSYLDNMFMRLPQTAQVKRAKEELFAMMEDKYHELKAEGSSENEAVGIVISEFGNLEELADSLGISEYLHENNQNNTTCITQQEVSEYLEVTGKYSIRIALGVMLCILSPIFLIVLNGISETQGLAFIENAANAIGFVVLLLMVAVAVALFIVSGYSYKKYDYLKEEEFWLDYDAEVFAKEEKADYQSVFAVSIALGVVLCVISVIPICLTGFLNSTPFLVNGCVGILLFLVSVGVFLFITAGMKNSAYQILLHEGDYTRKKKRENKVMESISSVYWCIITCIYLVWSFLRMNWGISWIIWPLAGVLYSAISGVIKLFVNKSDLN